MVTSISPITVGASYAESLSCHSDSVTKWVGLGEFKPFREWCKDGKPHQLPDIDACSEHDQLCRLYQELTSNYQHDVIFAEKVCGCIGSDQTTTISVPHSSIHSTKTSKSTKSSIATTLSTTTRPKSSLTSHSVSQSKSVKVSSTTPTPTSNKSTSTGSSTSTPTEYCELAATPAPFALCGTSIGKTSHTPFGGSPFTTTSKETCAVLCEGTDYCLSFGFYNNQCILYDSYADGLNVVEASAPGNGNLVFYDLLCFDCQSTPFTDAGASN